jgi:RNA polymerase sigma-70 factor (ECF subfamily)
MSEQIQSTELVNRWRAGDQQAATELFERYQDKLLRMVAARLNQEMLSKLDPEDLVQSIMRSAFRMTRDEPIEYSSESGFWKWLVSVGINKTLNRIDKETADKRGLSRTTTSGTAFDDRIGRDPTADEVAEFSDLLQNVLKRLNEPQRRLLLAKLDGLSQSEIASLFGVSSKTIQRMGPALRDAAISVLGDDLPRWVFDNSEYEEFWKELQQEPLEQWMDVESCQLAAKVGLTKLGEALESETTPLEVLKKIKSDAKQPIRSSFGQETGYPSKTLSCAYMLAIANASLLHRASISRDSSSELAKRVTNLLKEQWLDPKSREKLERFLLEQGI